MNSNQMNEMSYLNAHNKGFLIYFVREYEEETGGYRLSSL